MRFSIQASINTHMWLANKVIIKKHITNRLTLHRRPTTLSLERPLFVANDEVNIDIVISLAYDAPVRNIHAAKRFI